MLWQLARLVVYDFQKAIEMSPENKLYSQEYAKFVAATNQTGMELSSIQLAEEEQQTPVLLEFENPEVSLERNKSLIQIGDENYKLKNYDASIKNYQDALKLNPNDEVTLLKLGNIYKARNDQKEAANFYKKAIFVNPAYADGWFNLGLVRAGEKNYNEAKSCFKRVIALKPEYSNAYYALGMVNESSGDKAGALQNYNEFLRRKPDEKTAATVREKIKALQL